MLFDTYCFNNLLFTSGEEHIEKMQFVRNVGPLIFELFSTIFGTVVEENEKHRVIEIRFLGPLGPH